MVIFISTVWNCSAKRRAVPRSGLVTSSPKDGIWLDFFKLRQIAPEASISMPSVVTKSEGKVEAFGGGFLGIARKNKNCNGPSIISPMALCQLYREDGSWEKIEDRGIEKSWGEATGRSSRLRGTLRSFLFKVLRKAERLYAKSKTRIERELRTLDRAEVLFCCLWIIPLSELY